MRFTAEYCLLPANFLRRTNIIPTTNSSTVDSTATTTPVIMNSSCLGDDTVSTAAIWNELFSSTIILHLAHLRHLQT